MHHSLLYNKSVDPANWVGLKKFDDILPNLRVRKYVQCFLGTYVIKLASTECVTSFVMLNVQPIIIYLLLPIMQYYHFYYSLGFHKFKAAFHKFFVKNYPKSIIEQVRNQSLSKSPYLSLIYRGKLVIMCSVLSSLGRSDVQSLFTSIFLLFSSFLRITC